MNKLGEIKIKAQGSAVTTIDIEGVIGVPEDWQFENQENRVATYEKFRGVVDSISRLKASAVRVNIRSIGGSVEDALLIYEALCTLEVRVETYCHGYVASAATLIAQAGSRRFISSGALYLVHNATTQMDGNKDEAIRTANLLSKTDERIARIYADRSGSGVEIFSELMSRDGGRGEWLTPDEVVEFGLADEVVEVSPLKNFGNKIRNFAMSMGLGVGDFVEQVARSEKRVTHPEKQLATKNRIQELEIETAQNQVTSTMTMPREDPSLESPRQKANEAAYAQDIEVFKTSVI